MITEETPASRKLQSASGVQRYDVEKQRRGQAVGVESESRLWEKHGQKAGLEVGRWGTSAQWYPYS